MLHDSLCLSVQNDFQVLIFFPNLFGLLFICSQEAWAKVAIHMLDMRSGRNCLAGTTMGHYDLHHRPNCHPWSGSHNFQQ